MRYHFSFLLLLGGVWGSASFAADAMTCQEERLAGKRSSEKPVYSAESRRLGEQGKVVLKVSVNELGFPEDVQIAQSSGYPRLDEAAQTAARTWCFMPTKRDGIAVAGQLTVPMVFGLDKP